WPGRKKRRISPVNVGYPDLGLCCFRVHERCGEPSLIGRKPKVGVVALWKARIHADAGAVEPSQAPSLQTGTRISHRTHGRDRNRHLCSGGMADLPNNNERLAAEFQSLGVKSVPKERVAVQIQQISRRRIQSAGGLREELLSGFPVKRPNVNATM